MGPQANLANLMVSLMDPFQFHNLCLKTQYRHSMLPFWWLQKYLSDEDDTILVKLKNTTPQYVIFLATFAIRVAVVLVVLVVSSAIALGLVVDLRDEGESDLECLFTRL